MNENFINRVVGLLVESLLVEKRGDMTRAIFSPKDKKGSPMVTGETNAPAKHSDSAKAVASALRKAKASGEHKSREVKQNLRRIRKGRVRDGRAGEQTPNSPR